MDDYYTGEEYYVPPSSEAATALDFLGPGGSNIADEYRTYGQLYPASSPSILDIISNSARAVGQGLMSPRGLVGLLGLLAGGLQPTSKERGGVNLNLSPSKVTRKTTPGRYGPVSLVEYAANGGLMQAYANGGTITGTKQNPMEMEDGGFVLTAKAVKAGTPQGIQQLLPQARLIRGPGTGTSDHIPATIAGRTPARVSNGEMYVPKAQVDAAGGAPALYALMHQLQRRA